MNSITAPAWMGPALEAFRAEIADTSFSEHAFVAAAQTVLDESRPRAEDETRQAAEDAAAEAVEDMAENSEDYDNTHFEIFSDNYNEDSIVSAQRDWLESAEARQRFKHLYKRELSKWSSSDDPC